MARFLAVGFAFGLEPDLIGVMQPRPTGTITFLFTDIEGSSRLWEAFGEAMGLALAKHDTILREVCDSRGGFVFKTIGDAFCVAFDTAQEAVRAALEGQRLLVGESWESVGAIKVRMALHTGAAEARDGDYFGPALNRVARILSAAHGGQVLLSLATAELVRDGLPEGVTLRDLGERRLKDLNRPERVFQLVARDLPSEFPALRSLEAVPNNLPVQLTSFVGREREMAMVKELLGTTHLLTLTGPGGTGKTRLSLQVAADVLELFHDGAWLVELATISDPELVPEAVAGALLVREEAGLALPDTLANFLRAKTLLLILDNCEHVIGACARLAEKLLRACPQLQILASSREPLGIAGERTWPVPALSLPERWRESLSGADAAAKLAQFEAVRLFVDRAAAVRPAFALTNENAGAIAEICWRLDGIPLAIELAAARVKVLPVEQIATRLNDRFRLLTSGSRTALPRQQTLRALIDWSYEMLSEGERVLFRRLAVFAGGRTLEAVERVCAGLEREDGTLESGIEELDVLDLLTQLVDKSLVARERSVLDEARYTMIESIWHYARGRLADAGEVDAMRLRHLEYFVEFAEAAEPKLMGREQREWIERCAEEAVNFRLALRASAELAGAVEKGLRLIAALMRYIEVRGLLHETYELGEELLRHPEVVRAGPTATRGRALACMSRLAWIGDRLDSGARYAGEALETFRALGDAHGTAEALGDLALYEWDRGEMARAKELMAEAATLGEPLGDKRLEADLLASQSVAAAAEGDHEKALALNSRCLMLYVELGDGWSADGARWLVGLSATALGRFGEARENFATSLRTALELGNRWSVPHSLEAFAALAVAEKGYERAARLLGAAEALRAEAGISTEPSDHPALRELLASAAEALGTPECRVARREGRGLSMEKAAELALEG